MFMAHGIIKYGIRKEGTFAELAKLTTFIMSGRATR